MSVIEDSRKDLQDFIAPELRAIEARLTAVEKRLDGLQARTDKRFDAVDKRFDEMQARTDKGFDDMQKHMDQRFVRSWQKSAGWLTSTKCSFGSRAWKAAWGPKSQSPALLLKQRSDHRRTFLRNRSPKHRLTSPPVPVLRVPLVAFLPVQQRVHPGGIPVVSFLRLFVRSRPVAMRSMPQRTQRMALHLLQRFRHKLIHSPHRIKDRCPHRWSKSTT